MAKSLRNQNDDILKGVIEFDKMSLTSLKSSSTKENKRPVQRKIFLFGSQEQNSNFWGPHIFNRTLHKMRFLVFSERLSSLYFIRRIE
jgi:hypothetical protein